MFEGCRVSRSMFRKGARADAYAAVKAELRRMGWRTLHICYGRPLTQIMQDTPKSRKHQRQHHSSIAHVWVSQCQCGRLSKSPIIAVHAAIQSPTPFRPTLEVCSKLPLSKSHHPLSLAQVPRRRKAARRVPPSSRSRCLSQPGTA